MHTGGPWKATKVDRFLGGDYIITGNMQPSNGETDVAAVFGGKAMDRVAANARLIAAAPDLYEALDFAMNAMMGVREAFVELEIRVPPTLDSVIKRARETLSKVSQQQGSPQAASGAGLGG